MNRIAGWVGRAAVLAIFSVGVVVLLLWLAGKFASKVPSQNPTAPTRAFDAEQRLAPVLLKQLPLSESAVGSIRAVHETTIGSKLLARVVEVNLKAGQKVQTGDVLIRLDDTDLRAKLQQANGGGGGGGPPSGGR